MSRLHAATTTRPKLRVWGPTTPQHFTTGAHHAQDAYFHDRRFAVPNTTPELLESCYFIGGNVKYIDKNIGQEGLQVLLESTELGGEYLNSDKFTFKNTCLSNIEEAISYFMNMKSQKIIGFKL